MALASSRGGPVQALVLAFRARCVHTAEREFFIDNLLVRIHYIIVMVSEPASRHRNLNSLFQVALQLIRNRRPVGSYSRTMSRAPWEF